MKTIIGNLLDIQEGILVHQVNCIGVMGAGIARSIRYKWPNVFTEYVSFNGRLGDIQLVPVTDKLLVCNLFGQDGIGIGLQTDYKAISRALESLARAKGAYQVYFPSGIGCGLAGGDWVRYSGLIEKHIPNAIIVRLP